MEKKTIRDLIDTLTYTRETVRNEFARLKEKLERDKKDAAEKYNHGTQFYKEHLKNLDAKYEQDKQNIREHCKDMYVPIFEELETRARAKAGLMNKQLMDEVRAFEGMSLTADEYAAVLNQFGNRNYYVDRVLENLAESNGLVIYRNKEDGLQGLEPCLAKKLSILKELRKQADNFVEHHGTAYGGSADMRHALAAPVLLGMERRYTNGFYTDPMTPKQIASRVIETMRSNPGRASNVFDNALENATPAVRSAILGEISKAEDPTIELSIKRAKSVASVQKFDKGLYGAAEKAFYSLGQEGTDDDAVIHANSGNVYFKELVQEFRASAEVAE